MNELKKNFIYNITYQILVFIIPLILTPYLSRTIGVTGIGMYSYTYSIVYYFMLFTLLGVNNYGNRSIARVRDDKEKMSKEFWGIYIFQLFVGIIMLSLYVFYVLCIGPKYYSIALIQIMFLISSIIDINWFYFGIENFKLTITRNSFVKIISIVLILIFVKTKNDTWKYTLIMSGSTLISQILMWTVLWKKIYYVKVNFKQVISHIKPNLLLFIPVIAVSLYKTMDKIMLGMLSDINEVGYYENAEKIINVPLAIISALGTVMLPRMSNLIAKGKKDEMMKYIDKSIMFVMFLSLGMTFGLIAIGQNFAPIFFGDEFEKSGILIVILSVTVPFISFANVIRTQYLIPAQRDRIYIISVALGAISNLIMNYIFIPKFQSIGACIGTITAESLVMIYQTISIRKEMPVGKYICNCTSFIIKSSIMLVFINQIKRIDINKIVILVLQIFIGGCIYCLLNYKYIDSVICFKKFFNKLKIKKKSI